MDPWVATDAPRSEKAVENLKKNPVLKIKTYNFHSVFGVVSLAAGRPSRCVSELGNVWLSRRFLNLTLHWHLHQRGFIVPCRGGLRRRGEVECTCRVGERIRGSWEGS